MHLVHSRIGLPLIYSLMNSPQALPIVVWFKRDLRWHDHAPLANAASWASASGAMVLPLWVYEPELWAQPDMAPQHSGFAQECVHDLERWIAQDGGKLCLLRAEMLVVLQALHAQIGAFTLVSHEETGNGWTFARDLAVAAWCAGKGVEWREFPGNGVVRRLSALGGRDRWSRLKAGRMDAPVIAPPQAVRWLDWHVAGLPVDTSHGVFQSTSPVGDLPDRKHGGRTAAETELASFLKHRAQHYRFEMSSPVTAAQTCSRISAHLAWGSLSIRECLHAVTARRLALQALPAEKRLTGFLQSLRSFEGRLHWHCHFIQKLESEPAIEFKNVNRGFDGLRNEADSAGELSVVEQQRLAAWCSGDTGYPFVDACMRSLLATGWINFRMRAMLMSFASYQLWLHWRPTGLHLARAFTDYEPGIHWSQCQMQSGVTGINTIRIYCPVKQSRDQDPSGAFIRAWLPALRDPALVPDTLIHEPWRMLTPPPGYPAPIVDLKAATLAAKNRIYPRKAEPEVQAQARQVFDKHGSRASNRAAMERGGQRPAAASKQGSAVAQNGAQQMQLDW